MRAGRAIRGGIVTLAACLALLGVAGSAQGALTTQAAFSGSVTQPMYVTAPPGDSHRLFIVTRPGVIYVAVDGVLQSTPYLDIKSRVWQSGEAGMASMAFDPGFSDPLSPGYGHFYVYFVQVPSGSQTNGPIHVEEFTADPTSNAANPASARLVLEIPHNDANNHYGGTLQFNPVDGLLYVATGDGGGGDNQFRNAQDTKKSLLGKLLRIDPHASPYSIPDGNPFKGQPLCNPPSGTTNCPEVYAYGLRNPFRWSFDRATGDIAIGDVGQSLYEEVDYVPRSDTLAGDNFGWPCREGPVAHIASSDARCGSIGPFVDPVSYYSHSGLSGSVAITGGAVVRDPGLPTLLGRYLYADFYQGVVHSLQLATPTASGDRVEADLPTTSQLVSFGEDADGHVYLVSLAGSVSRIIDTSAPTGGGAAGGTGGTPPPSSDPGTAPTTAGSEPPGGQGSTSAPSALDSVAPTLFIRAAHVQDVLRRQALRLSVASSEACVVRVTARVQRAGASALALRSVLQRLAPRKRIVIQLKASPRVRRALAHRGAIALSIRGRDAAGNLRTVALTVRVKR
jgi:glucose/arabinose dehydrogenase